MKKKIKIGMICLSMLLLITFSCEKLRTYPIEPEISFKSILVSNAYDSLLDQDVKRIILTIHVIDGDGDVGIFGENNYIYPGFEDLDSSDLFITLYEKINGEFQKVDLLGNYKIPYMESSGQDKSIVADLEVTIDYSMPFFTYDTLKYSFYMYDRQKHKSNTAETPEIPGDTLGLIEGLKSFKIK